MLTVTDLEETLESMYVQPVISEVQQSSNITVKSVGNKYLKYLQLVSMLALQSKGHGFDPPLFQSF